MSKIPGLLVCPDDENDVGGIEIQSFTENIIIPESHRYGNCPTLNDFEKLETINEGTFGVLYKCRRKKSNEIYALRKFRIPDLHDVMREINILNTLKHPNFVNSHGTVAGRNLESNYLILDYCVASLKDLVDRNVEAIYNKAVVKYIMRHLLKGLEYIHRGQIIHRDICSKNILFTHQGVLKIGGFEASRFYSKGNMTPGVTEVNYRAPELLFKAKIYSSSADMWSAGCVFAQLLLKKTLFSGTSEIEVLKSIFNVLGTPSETIWTGFNELFQQMEENAQVELEFDQPYCDLKKTFDCETPACIEFIQDLIIYFPNARMTAIECLKSPYFNEMPHAYKPEDLASELNNILSVPGPSTANN